MYKKLVLMLMAISFLFTGCQSKTPIVSSNSAQSSSQPKPPFEIAYSLEPVEFQENITLQKREEIHILDANESSIVFAVYVNNNEPGEMEPAPSYTDRICIYNIADKQTKMLKQLGSGNFCNDGVVLPNNDAVYCTIQRIEGKDTDKFTIYKKSDNQEKVIDSGFCGDYPLIVKLADGEVAYSYIESNGNDVLLFHEVNGRGEFVNYPNKNKTFLEKV